jgi:hypothetical protein
MHCTAPAALLLLLRTLHSVQAGNHHGTERNMLQTRIHQNSASTATGSDAGVAAAAC